MKVFSKYLIIMLLVTLLNVGVDIPGIGYTVLTAYAEQVSEVEEGAVSDVSEIASDADSDAKSEAEADADSDDDKSEGNADTDSSDAKSEDEADGSSQQVQAVESFNLDDKSGSVKEIEFSRPERKQTEAETVEETEPETVKETVPETAPESVPETVEETVPETVPETVKETVEETVPETVPESVPETAPETESERPSESHQSKGGSGKGGSSSRDNSEMNWLNNKVPELVNETVPTPVIEANFPEASSIPEEPSVPEELLGVPRSVPKTGENNVTAALLIAGTLCLLSAITVSMIDDSVRVVFYNTEGAYKELRLSTVKAVLFAAWGTITLAFVILYVIPMTIDTIRQLPLGLVITWEGNPLLMM